VADSRLHLTIAAASGSPSLQTSIADVQLTLDRLLSAIPVLRRNLDHSDAQHSRIVSAILAATRLPLARDGGTLHGTAELLRGLLRRRRIRLPLRPLGTTRPPEAMR
jgi:hypothetical protein